MGVHGVYTDQGYCYTDLKHPQAKANILEPTIVFYTERPRLNEGGRAHRLLGHESLGGRHTVRAIAPTCHTYVEVPITRRHAGPTDMAEAAATRVNDTYKLIEPRTQLDSVRISVV